MPWFGAALQNRCSPFACFHSPYAKRSAAPDAPAAPPCRSAAPAPCRRATTSLVFRIAPFTSWTVKARADLLAETHAAGARYVIRLAHDRKVVGERKKLRQVVDRATRLFRREVRVSPRGAGRPHDHHTARQAREATLDVSAMAVELVRSSNFAPGSPPSLKVYVVTVVERDCPKATSRSPGTSSPTSRSRPRSKSPRWSTPTAHARSSKSSSRPSRPLQIEKRQMES